jgi:paired amphipathic helix protein Sin3a
MTAQLLGKDDSSFDDSEVSTGRWQAYIDSFVAVCPRYRDSILLDT